MCKSPDIPAPVMPTQYAAAKAPSRATARTAGDRMSDSVRGAQSTILTTPLGVTQGADTGKKTLLGA